MNTLMERKLRLEALRAIDQIRKENELARINLETARDLCMVWSAACEQIEKYPLHLIARLEAWIKAEAKDAWGEKTMVMFNRIQLKVTFAHPDGRRLTYPYESITQTA